MGAGASSDGGELEQLVACTYLLGQALASMSFPDMYRIQDFHAEDAPALRSARGLAADRENAAREAAQPFDYGSRFNVMVSGERADSACHRGFEPIVRRLLAAPGAAADLGHVPDGDAARRFPFARPPPQSCLGEAARCGFKDIAVLLLEAGAPKDLANGIGWTPLHEAAFYNHVDVVRSLLVYGADATLRDAQDALAYHVASLGSVRDVLEEMGGELCGEGAAAPRADRDRIAFVFGDAEDPASRVGVAGAPLLAEGKDDDAPSGAAAPRRPADRRRLSPGAAPAPAPDASTPARGGLAAAPPDAPEEFLCAISRRVLKEPLASPYGHVFEAKVIRAWFAKNGSICPLTGQPLVESELKIHDALKTKITNWEVTRTLASVSAASPEPPAKETAHQHDDDLYDF
ncbi:hypothetical protein JL721_10335 [Aureococcus anophagefferens]|nr:hypothetical protein JL721_10335 [Aureococcus anophagefferens]